MRSTAPICSKVTKLERSTAPICSKETFHEIYRADLFERDIPCIPIVVVVVVGGGGGGDGKGEVVKKRRIEKVLGKGES
jgi:hypothetical protein